VIEFQFLRLQPYFYRFNLHCLLASRKQTASL
jgi:hypothetical protein